jgi:hypothetical protein
VTEILRFSLPSPDNIQALTLLPELPAEVRYVLGDQHCNDPVIAAACTQAGQIVVATRRGPYPHTDDGVDVHRLLRELRSRAIENLNEQFKGIFDAHSQVPTQGLANTRRFALGAVFVYRLSDSTGEISYGSAEEPSAWRPVLSYIPASNELIRLCLLRWKNETLGGGLCPS